MHFKFTDFSYFDAHTHFFPPPLLNAIWCYFETNYWPIYRKDTPEALAQALVSEYRVKHFLILNYAHKSGIAREMNDWTYDFCSASQRSGIAIPFGTIHPSDEDRAHEMDRIFGKLRFAGIKLQLMVTDFNIWDKRMDPVYQKILQYNRILLVHIGTGPTYSNFHPGKALQCPYLGYKNLRRLMDKYPEMKVIVPHLGAQEYEQMWSLIKDFPNLYFDTAMISVKSNPAFDDQLHLVNNEILYEIADRVLFGSDFPNIPYNFRNSVLGWLERNMERTFYEKIFFRNAESLFRDYF
ncbi:MAG: amidohydrolase family protein [Candidatus Hermodarchaeota archaeon]